MKPLRTIRAQQGAALPFALLVLLLITVLGFALVTLGMTEVSIATNWRSYSTAFYAADAGIEMGVVNLRNLLGQTPNPANPQVAIGNQKPTLSDNRFAFPNNPPISITAVSPTYPMTFNTGAFSGLSGLSTDYQIRSVVTGSGGTRADLTEVVKYIQIPLFQFGVFYGKGVDMEIEPGPAMTLNGRVFSNSNIYIGAGTSLTVQKNVKTAGKIYRTVKSSVSSFSGTLNPVTGTYDATSYTFGAGSPVNPQIADAGGTLKTLNFDSTYQPGGSTKWASTSAWASQATSTFGGQVADGSMGVGQITPPVPDLFNDPANPAVVAHQMIEMPKAGDSAALKAAKLYTQAGLRIIDGVATDQNGSSVSLPSGTITPTTFYDAREAKTVNVYDVDISKLNNNRPANGLVYIASTAPSTSSTMPGVRLKNGAKLPQNGVTVASQNPVYIQGDYNTQNYGGNHPPAAVMGDAVTVLSNNWGSNNSDTKGNQTTNKRSGTATTVNAALATGPSAESTSGTGNGQLENDIRFLEDWNGANFTYSGSIVSLWHSLQATKPWQCCGSGAGQYYTPPARNWSYDILFDTTPPPGTPMGVLILKGRWSQS